MAVSAADYVGTVTIADGAWGTELDRLGCPPGYCREEWNVTEPAKVRQVAAAYVAAGAQILMTNTFGANRFVLGRHDLADKVRDFNRAGAEISKAAAGDKAKVFASMGSSGKMVMMGEATEEALFEAFCEQADALAEGGADGLVIETMTELAEMVPAIKAAKRTGLMTVACMTYDSGRDKTATMMGVLPAQAVEAAIGAGADMVGCNCGVGIEPYLQVTALLREATDKPVWVKANAGLPEIEGGNIVYKVTPEAYAEQAKGLVAAGANVVGGCCGTTPAFVQALCAALR